MPVYFKKTQVEAVQFLPTKEQKDSLNKDPKGVKVFQPAIVFGGSLKVKKAKPNFYYASINIGSEEVTIEEGDWLVTEFLSKKTYVVHDAEFKKYFSTGVAIDKETPTQDSKPDVKKEIKK